MLDAASDSSPSLPPIPMLGGVSGRVKVHIKECGETMVPLSKLAPSRIRLKPEYYLRGKVSAPLECYARRSVAIMLVQAANLLRSDLRLLIFDAWRPTLLQREIYEEQKLFLRKQFPALSEEQIDEETQRYVSLPSDDPKSPAPHLTGGSIDITLSDINGYCLPMGTEFDHFGPEAATRYFEDKLLKAETLTIAEYSCLQNRRLLFHVLAKVGFTNYHEEWWHFDYGNQFWGKITGKQAIYGPVYPYIDIP